MSTSVSAVGYELAVAGTGCLAAGSRNLLADIRRCEDPLRISDTR